MDWWLQDKGFQEMWSSSNGVINAKKIQVLKKELNALEAGISDRILNQFEVELKKSLQEQLWHAANAYECMLKQKAIVKWLKEGDRNSAYFHKLINHRRRHNAIQGLIIDGEWVQDPSRVKTEAFNHFKDRFSEQNFNRPTLDGVQLPSLGQSENEALVARFSDADTSASNTAGGLLCIWNNQTFRVERKATGRGFIFLEGVWVQNMQRLFLVNVYVPCDVHSRRTLWEDIKQIKSHNPDGNWCIMGGFNSIRDPSERVSAFLTETDNNSISEFNNWLADLEVDEVQCVGRRFTWYRPNGTAKSRLDRVFVSHDWLSLWPGSTYFILDRNFSNHCPILFKATNADWGPKPFRVLDCWLTDKSFQDLVKGTWRNTTVRGWGGYSLKEKIKRLKPCCLEFNQLRAEHLFFNCSKTLPLWWESMSWGPFLQHGMEVADVVRSKTLKCWWIALTWTIWHHRNKVVFQDTTFHRTKLLEDALFLLWSWIKAMDKDFTLHFNQWSSNLKEGLGRGVIWASIRYLVGKHKVDLLCLQETQRDSLDKAAAQALWGHSDFAWEWFPAVNTAGGMLCIWNDNNFKVDFRLSEKGLILLGGVWMADLQRVVVANIYAPCDVEGKRQLWQSLSTRKLQSQEGCWCLVGDFNCI
ncbi:hypothetical protein GmHk_08G023421 [Glycine max]|nr:hypothetical protein GmHk_08G023421 [Glycine max]